MKSDLIILVLLLSSGIARGVASPQFTKQDCTIQAAYEPYKLQIFAANDRQLTIMNSIKNPSSLASMELDTDGLTTLKAWSNDARRQTNMIKALLEAAKNITNDAQTLKSFQGQDVNLTDVFKYTNEAIKSQCVFTYMFQGTASINFQIGGRYKISSDDLFSEPMIFPKSGWEHAAAFPCEWIFENADPNQSLYETKEDWWIDKVAPKSFEAVLRVGIKRTQISLTCNKPEKITENELQKIKEILPSKIHRDEMKTDEMKQKMKQMVSLYYGIKYIKKKLSDEVIAKALSFAYTPSCNLEKISRDKSASSTTEILNSIFKSFTSSVEDPAKRLPTEWNERKFSKIVEKAQQMACKT